MSRRPPALLILAVLCLLAAGLISPFLAAAAYASPYGSHVYQANPYVVPGAQSFSVYSGSTLAQSFTVNQTYILENVTLRVVNGGGALNMLRVSIHQDDPVYHVPLMSGELANWSQATFPNDPTPVNGSWAFGPEPVLVAGDTYWIVAQNSAAQASGGYEWFSTNGIPYPDGRGLLYANGSWSGLPYALFFLTYGQQYDANLTPSMTVNRTQAMPGDSVGFRINFNNTGAHAAPRVWVNDTLPAALTNVTLSFPNVQPLSASTFPNLVFANVTNGPHWFTFTAQVALGTTPGVRATNTASLVYANATNASIPAGTASASLELGLVTSPLYLAGTSGTDQLLTTTKPSATTPQTSSLIPGGASVVFALAPPLAKPFHLRDATATLWLKPQSAPPQTFSLNLSLLDNGSTFASLAPSFQLTSTGFQRFTFDFPVSDYTFPAGHAVQLQIASLGGVSGSTDTLVVAYNSTLQASQLDASTDTYVAIAPLVLGSQTGPTTNWAPFDSLVVQANVSDPFGTGQLRGVWINITSPSQHLAASGPMTLNATDNSALPSWERFTYTLAPPLTTGLYRVVVEAMDDAGIATLAQAWANVTSPVFAFTAMASPDQVETGNALTYTLYFNNTGTGTAGWAWVNDTIPEGFTYVSSDANVTAVSGANYTWSFTGVGIGTHVLHIRVLATGGFVGWVYNEPTLDFKDRGGNSLPTQAANASVFLNGPDVALAVASTPSNNVHANQTVTYTLTIANTGTAANHLWVNETLPTSFAYYSTSAGIFGGYVTIAGAVVQLSFVGMPANTTWTFDVVARAGPVLVRNGTYVSPVVVTAESANGSLPPAATGGVSLLAVAPWIPSGSIRFLDAAAAQSASTPAEISFANIGNEAAALVWVNLTLDPRLAPVNASASYMSGAGSLVFAMTNVRVGVTNIFLNLSVSPYAADRAVLSIVGDIMSRDGGGNALPIIQLSAATITVSGTQMGLSVSPGNPVFEAGAPYPLSVAISNAGSDAASDVWLNLTFPASLVYLNDSATVPVSVTGSGYSWHWQNVSAGTVGMQLYLEARTTSANGTSVQLAFHLDFQGSSHDPLPSIAKAVSGTVIAADIVLDATPSGDSLISGGGDTLVYSVRVTNLGLATAESVFLVDTLDSRLQAVYYVSSVTAVQTNQTYNWTFADLAPGATQVVNLTVRVPGGVAAGAVVPNVFEAAYTNSVGVIIGRVRSTPTTITVQADYTFLAWLGIGAAAIAIAAVAFLRRERVDIEDAFLVYRDGVLISHLSRTLLQEKDEDVVSGMLTAVQEFVREAFQYGEHRDLHQLDFGDYRILIERGKYVFLAVVYSGKESLAIRRKVRAVIDRVEDEFGKALETWDGDMEQVMGARDLIRDTLLGSGKTNHTAKAPVADGE